MRSNDIILGKYYRLKSSPSYGWIKPIAILKPHTSENEHSFILIKSEHVVNKEDTVGFIRFFKLNEIINN